MKTVTMPAAYHTGWKKCKENSIIQCCALSVKDKTHLTMGMRKTTFFSKLSFRRNVVKYAQNLVCVNSTYSTTVYDFQLITVLVTDDYNEGIPMTWLISNACRKTTDMLHVVFLSSENKYCDVRAKIFVSDDAKAYHMQYLGFCVCLA